MKRKLRDRTTSIRAKAMMCGRLLAEAKGETTKSVPFVISSEESENEEKEQESSGACLDGNINELPDLVILQIFDRLPLPDLVLRASLVCKLWRSLALEPELWRTARICLKSRATDEALLRLVGLSVRIRHLDLSNTVSVTGKAIAEALKKCPGLRFLSLNYLTSMTEVVFAAVASCCPELRELHLKRCVNLTDSALLNIAFSRCSDQLAALDVSNCEQLSNESLAEIAANCGNLTGLNIASLERLTDDSLKVLAGNCAAKLESLDCSKCDFSGAALTEYLPKFSALKELRMARMPHLTGSVVLASVGECSNLVTLDLTGLKALSCTLFYRIISRLSLLEKLILRNCILYTTTTGVHLNCNPHEKLRFLDLSGRTFNIAVTSQIARQLPSLTTLVVSDSFSAYTIWNQLKEELTALVPNLNISLSKDDTGDRYETFND